MKYNKFDILVMEKITKQILIIEGSIPGDTNLVERTANKNQKYSQLGSELIKLNGMKTAKMTDLVIGATGMVLSTIKNFETLFKENSTHALQLSQKAEIMGTLKIFKSFCGLNVLNFNLRCSTVFGNFLFPTVSNVHLTVP